MVLFPCPAPLSKGMDGAEWGTRRCTLYPSYLRAHNWTTIRRKHYFTYRCAPAMRVAGIEPTRGDQGFRQPAPPGTKPGAFTSFATPARDSGPASRPTPSPSWAQGPVRSWRHRPSPGSGYSERAERGVRQDQALLPGYEPPHAAQSPCGGFLCLVHHVQHFPTLHGPRVVPGPQPFLPVLPHLLLPNASADGGGENGAHVCGIGGDHRL